MGKRFNFNNSSIPDSPQAFKPYRNPIQAPSRTYSRHRGNTISPFQYNAYLGDSAITYLQGIKAGDKPGTYLLVGANDSPGPTPLGLAYLGPLDAKRNAAFNGSNGSGTWHEISVPRRFGAAGTSVYGPDNLGSGHVNYVGAYTRNLNGKSASPKNPSIVGFTYDGKLNGSTEKGYRSIQGLTDSGVRGTYTFVHSVDGGLAVGNTDLADVDNRTGYFSLKSTAFIVRLKDGKQQPIKFPNNDSDDSDLITHTAYGIWDNGNGRYTIAGGSGTVLKPGNGVSTGAGYLIDYDSITGTFSHYTQFNFQNRDRTDLITHFEGIYRDSKGNYWLPATSVSADINGDLSIASVAKVSRNRSGSFDSKATWEKLTIQNSTTGQTSVLSTGNSLYGNIAVGLASYPNGQGSLNQADYVLRGDWLSFDPGILN